MKDFFENISSCFLIVNSQGLVLECDSNFEKKSGYKREEVKDKKHIYEILGDISSWKKLDWGYETYLTKSNGEKIKIFINFFSFSDYNLNIITINDFSFLTYMYENYASFISQSPFPIIEVDLSEMFNYFRIIKKIAGNEIDKYLEIYPEAIYEIIGKIKFIYINESFYNEYKGFSFDALKENVFNYFTEEGLNTLKNELLKVYDGNLNLNFEVEVIDPIGKLRFINVYVYPVGRERVLIYILDKTKERELEEDLRRSVSKITNLYNQVINTLSSIMEHKDSYTAYHQKRVAELSHAIAKEIGLPKDKVDAIRIGALLHDIGKIAIPGEILNKPGKLNNIEMEIVKTHPLTGYNMLKNVDFPPEVLYIVLQHHERLDGSGYPEGLKNGEINLSARIVAVADVVDAMISHRPYRPPFGIDKALEEIEKNKGTKYDPDVVDACIRLFKEKDFKFSI
ncbi:HD domain-containing phosphohydrolase [Dictyoglomus turgidum]|jgi:putative nucleotidyltransferase with HDIG domain|uniref:HD domain-containing phosphohydrolase n=1 Tax=Dictyoglomus TaxID=13 RepID=UPI0023553280|nr:HD domain-containing phosphohydrolase [Dictyoglomus turgidum]